MRTLRKVLLYYIIIVFTCILQAFVNKKVQYEPMLLVMYASPFFYMLTWLQNKHSNISQVLMWCIAGLMSLSAVINSSQFRLSTFMYSMMFIVTYLLYSNLLSTGDFKRGKFIKLVKIIIYAYFIVLIIQQVSVVTGLSYVFNRAWEFEDNRFKLNSLAIEPSNVGVILPLLMYTFMSIKETICGRKYKLKDIRKDAKIWLSYSYVMLTCGSLSCILAYGILLLYFVSFKNFIPACIIGLLSLGVVAYLQPSLIERLLELTNVTRTFNVASIFDTDSSSSARIAPFIIYLQEFDITNLHTWFGYGCDYGKTYLTIYLLGYLPDSDQGIGGFIDYLYDYGLISGIGMLSIICKLCHKIFSFEMLLFIVLVSVVPFNHYVFWLYYMLLFTVSFYKKSKFTPIQLVSAKNSKL